MANVEAFIQNNQSSKKRRVWTEIPVDTSQAKSTNNNTAPVKSAPADFTGAKSTGADSSPAEPTGAKSAGANSAPDKSAGAKNARADLAPAKSTAAESTGAVSAPVDSASAKSAGVDFTPAKYAGADTAPVDFAGAKTARAESTPVNSTGAKTAGVNSDTVKSTRDKTAGAEATLADTAPAVSASVKKAAFITDVQMFEYLLKLFEELKQDERKLLAFFVRKTNFGAIKEIPIARKEIEISGEVNFRYYDESEKVLVEKGFIVKNQKKIDGRIRNVFSIKM